MYRLLCLFLSFFQLLVIWFFWRFVDFPKANNCAHINMKLIILIVSCFYLIISIKGRNTPNLSEPNQVYNERLMSYGTQQVSGFLCGEQLFRSNYIEDTKIQACRNLKSLNFLHRYRMKYRPRKGSRLAMQQTPGQDYYIFPLRESSKMKRLKSKLIKKKKKKIEK